jgi:hypothetical protein
LRRTPRSRQKIPLRRFMLGNVLIMIWEIEFLFFLNVIFLHLLKKLEALRVSECNCGCFLNFKKVSK